METVKAKKSLGQNFLIDETVLQDISFAIDPKKNETIVEIGPGHGELTEYLVANGAKVIAIEKDSSLINELNDKFQSPNFKLKHGDALEIIRHFDLGISPSAGWKLCGNIPYYITGQLFRIIGELKNKPEKIVFTIQKEVALRICAKPRTMNLLAASIQIWAEPEIIRIVGKESFNPKPKVDSAIIRLVTKSDIPKDKDLKKYYELLHIVFKQPRKTIFNNLRAENIKDPEKILAALKIKAAARPQDLSVNDLLGLALQTYQ